MQFTFSISPIPILLKRSPAPPLMMSPNPMLARGSPPMPPMSPMDMLVMVVLEEDSSKNSSSMISSSKEPPPGVSFFVVDTYAQYIFRSYEYCQCTCIPLCVLLHVFLIGFMRHCHLLRLLGCRCAAGLGSSSSLQLDLSFRSAHHLLARLGHLLHALVSGSGCYNLCKDRIDQ